jgi:hypothetical protein
LPFGRLCTARPELVVLEVHQAAARGAVCGAFWVGGVLDIAQHLIELRTVIDAIFVQRTISPLPPYRISARR